MSIDVAVIGVGNCAKSLLEGIAYYTLDGSAELGLMSPRIGPYPVSAIRVVCAFDIDSREVGDNLNAAAAAEPNRTSTIGECLPSSVVVQRGPTGDSVIQELREYYIRESPAPPVDVANALRTTGAELVVNYLPTGSDEATYAYAEAALQAGCGFINCMPTVLARDPEWRRRFQTAGLVLMGDDIKSQCGATIVNRTLLKLFTMRGIRVTTATQVNYGGNADHFNLHHRADAKEACKQAALHSVQTNRDAPAVARMIYTEQNYDHKKADIRIEGQIFGGVPVSLQVTLEDEDSPNSGGVVVDAIRAAKLLTERGKQHEATALCSFLMKAPPRQCSDEEALAQFRKILETCM